jgi:hypothetical protein
MNPWLAYLAVMLAFVVGYMIGHRFGRVHSDRHRVLSVMTTNAAYTPAVIKASAKRRPAKITAKRKAKP